METQFTPSLQTSSLLQLYLLGVPQILYQGQSLTLLLSRRAQALLYFLVVEPKLHKRDYLASLFWPDVTDTQARKNLRNILPELRTYLGNYLYVDAQSIGITNVDKLWCDVYVLEQANANIRSAFTESDVWDLSTIYQGEFLDGFSVSNAPFYEEWLVTHREYYRIVILEALHLGANQLLTDGKIELGIQATRLLIKIEPLNEAAYRLLMQFLMWDGQRGAALTQYETLKRLLASEIGVDPTQETQSLAAKLMLEQSPNRNSPGEIPTSMHPSARIVDNLPGELTSFIGRQRETQELYAALCNPNYRLITVTGLGGMGKTRLALNVARLFLEVGQSEADRERPLFTDGIYFVSLIGIEADEQDHSRIALAIGDALKLTRNSQADPAKQLLLELSDKEILLILDNYEHLLAANGYLLELLRHSPQSKLLITSRSILDLQVEKVYALEGLATPPVTTVSTSDNSELESYESVVLFRTRMQHATRKSVIKQEDLTEILQICRYVDGLPLAIELAAAMTRYYSCKEIGQKLSTEAIALDTNLQDVPLRHRSLMAIADYSSQLLTVPQRRVLEACTVFAEPFTVQASSFVANAEPHLIFSLVDASLLKPTDAGRFEMHPLVQQYALSKLRAEPAFELEVRRRHAEYFANLVEPNAEELFRSPIKFQRIQREFANLRVAWQFAVEYKLYSLSMRMVEGLFLHFLFQGPIREGVEFCDLLLASFENDSKVHRDQDQLSFFSVILTFRIFCLMFNGSNNELDTSITYAFGLAEQTANFQVLTLLHFVSAYCAYVEGDLESHEKHHRLGIEIAQTNHIHYAVAIHLAHWSLGAAAKRQVSEALARIQESLRILDEYDYQLLYGYVLDELSFVYLMVGELQLAHATIQQALQRNQEVNTVFGTGYLYERAALYAESVGDYQQALSWAQRLIHHNTDLQNLETQFNAMFILGRSLAKLGNLGAAEDNFSAALKIAESAALQPFIIKTQVELASLALLRGDAQCAINHFRIAHQIVSTNNSYYAALTNAGLGNALFQQNQNEEALLRVENAATALLIQPLESHYLVAEAILYALPVLYAHNDSQGPILLRRAYEYIINQSEKISDDAVRHSFLENVTAHRQLLSLAREMGVIEK